MKIIILLCATIFLNKCFCINVFFESCNKHGFSCQNSTLYKDKQDITYQCLDESLKGITLDFWIWNFAPTLDIGTLTITDCHTLRLRFGRNHVQKVQILYVHHITDLRIYQDQLICNPTSIIFEDIDNLRTLPRNAFSQVQSVCSSPNSSLNKLVFENVKIGTIETNAIELINNVQLFRITNVVIKNIQAGGIRITNNNDASIYILNSSVDLLDTLAMQIHANKLTITESTFNLMSYSSINATLHTFEFSANSVVSVLTAAFSIEANNVNILKNHFQNVKTGAFQKISAVDNKHFSYKFIDNFITDADVASLHPMIPFSTQSNIMFSNNKFACTCDGYLWLRGQMLFGKRLKYSQSFYKSILDTKNNNTCVFKTCILPLKAVKKISTSDNTCLVSSVAGEADFCESYDFDDNASKCLFNVVWLNLLCYFFIVYL